MLKGEIHKTQENFVNMQDLELSEEFKEYLNDYENSFLTEVYTNKELFLCKIYQEDIDCFLNYEKESGVDFDEISFYRDLEKLNDFMIKNNITKIII